MSAITAVCFVNFHGDLRETACGKRTKPDFAGTTVFMSSATCPRCIAKIQSRLGELQLSLVASSLNAASSVSRIVSLDIPAPLAQATP